MMAGTRKRSRVAGVFLGLLVLCCAVSGAHGIVKDAKAAVASLTDHFFGFGKEGNGAPTPEEKEEIKKMDALWVKTETFHIKREADLQKVMDYANDRDVIVFEAFADWCGACKKYRPTYEKIANYFNTAYELTKETRDKSLPRVFITRANCGGEDSVKKLCDKFAFEGYPHIAYGGKDKFRNHLSIKKTEELEELDDSEKTLVVPDSVKFSEGAPGMITLLETYALSQVGIFDKTIRLGYNSYTEEDRKAQLEEFKMKQTYGNKIDVRVHDMEISTALSLKFLNTALNIRREGARDAFIHWEGWIAHFHPSELCMQGAINILSDIDTIWPTGGDPDKIEENLMAVKQCGDEVEEDESAFWGCTEYTCGLWMTFHAMSVTEDAYINPETGADLFSGADMMTTLKGFITNFFMCDVCRKHFVQVMGKETVGPTNQKTFQVSTQKDFALWLWEAHNVVNVRLGKEEEQNQDGNPDRPKVIFPPRKDCDVCLQDGKSDDYSLEHVHEYLKILYTNPKRQHPERQGFEKKLSAYEIKEEEKRKQQEEMQKRAKEEQKARKERIAARKERKAQYEAQYQAHEDSGILRVLLAVLAIVAGCIGLLIYFQRSLYKEKRYKQYKGYYE